MDKIEKFEDLRVWQAGMDLSVQIYETLQKSKAYGLKNQMQRAAVSIPSNISEGFERNSNKEFIYFLFIAKGSCAELRTQLYLAKDLKIIDIVSSNDLIESTRKISSMLYRLIETRRKNFK